jgi:hypothetical protein
VATGTPSTAEPKPVDRPPRPSDLVLQHLPLALTAAVFALVFVRLLVVSRGDAITARAILASAGPTEVVLGAVLTVLPGLLVVIAIVIPWVFRMPLLAPTSYMRVAWGFAVALVLLITGLMVVVGLYTQSLTSFGFGLAVAFVLGAAVEWSIRREAAKDPTQSVTPGQTTVLGIAVVIFLSLISVGDEPWLPPEKVEVHGQDPLVGYVLDVSDTELVVLEDEDRKVTRLDLDDVESREICRLKTAVLNRHEYDRCPG